MFLGPRATSIYPDPKIPAINKSRNVPVLGQRDSCALVLVIGRVLFLRRTRRFPPHHPTERIGVDL